MGFGSTAKKIQKLADVADKMYKKVNEVLDQLQELRVTVEDTGSRVEDIERELEQQRSLLEAIAEEQDIDVDSVVTETVIPDAEGEELVADAEAADGTDESPAED